MLRMIRRALSAGGEIPLTLVALDEVQQYIGEDTQRSIAVQELAEVLCSGFGGRLLLVGTGQSALSGTALLARLQGRFPYSVELSDTDVDAVVRKVVLAKRPDRVAAIEKELEDARGEIERHLRGSRLEHRSEDLDHRVADYPLLPVRRRFWEKALQAVDRPGTAAQLRNQLRVVHQAARDTANGRVGTVVGGDFIFGAIAPDLRSTGVLPRETDEHFRRLAEGDEAQRLQARLLGLVFLVGKLPRKDGLDQGVRATPEMLADLLVTDLDADNTALRAAAQAALEAMAQDGLLMRVEGEYRIRTQEGRIWVEAYRRHLVALKENPQRLDQERATLLREKCSARLKGTKLLQGRAKVPRKLSVHYGADRPKPKSGEVRLWVRDGWEEDATGALGDARAVGNESALLFAHLPIEEAEELKGTLATARAAQATLDEMGVRDTADGIEARTATETRQIEAEQKLGGMLGRILARARVFLGGGTEVEGGELDAKVRTAAEAALVRMFPRFGQGDHVGWARVVVRARKGDGGALEAVGHKGNVDQHAVTKAVLSYLGSARKGAEVRERFLGGDYGWPQDTVEGALLVLTAAEHLLATDAQNRSIPIDTLDRKRIGQARFRREEEVITPAERIRLRALYKSADVPCKTGEEGPTSERYLARLQELASSAGGEPPCPSSPDTKPLAELGGKSGNERLRALLDGRQDLEEQAEGWEKTAKDIEKRLPAWETLAALVPHVAPLAGGDDIRAQADAVRDGRQLLAEPNPVPEWVKRATDLLRAALLAARQKYVEVFEVGMAALVADPVWQKLGDEHGEEAQQEVLEQQGLTSTPSLDTTSAETMLAGLKGVSLARWRERTEGLPQRFSAALLEAARRVRPESQEVELPRRTLEDEAAAEAWLDEVRALLLEALESGPVVLS